MKSSIFKGALVAVASLCASTAPAFALNFNGAQKQTNVSVQPFLCNYIDSTSADAFAGFIRIKGHGNVGEIQVYPDSTCSAGMVLKQPAAQSYPFTSVNFDLSGYQDDTYGPFMFALLTDSKGRVYGYEAIPADGTSKPVPGGFTNYTVTAANFGAPSGLNFSSITFQLFPYTVGLTSTSSTLTTFIVKPQVANNPDTVLVPKTAYNYCPLGFADPRSNF